MPTGMVFDRAVNSQYDSEDEHPPPTVGSSDDAASSIDGHDGFGHSVRSREETVWRCMRCDSDRIGFVEDKWICLVCRSLEFYNSAEPNRRETPEGCWTYIPRLTTSPPPSPSPSHSPDFDLFGPAEMTDPGEPEQHNIGSSPGGPPDEGRPRENPESETSTHDPSVDPDTGLPLNRRRRRQRRNAGRRAIDGQEPEVNMPPGLSTPAVADDKIIAALRQLLGEQQNRNKSDNSVRTEQSYDSRKGPAPGVKFRGGTPPAPPQWRGSSQDLRAFSRWERRIEVWMLQIKSYMTDSDAALSLFTSLSGEAEAEIEHLDLKKVHHKDGIAYIMESLREPLQQKQLFQKRKLLADYEAVSRHGSETMRQYVNRYKRIERDLESIGISASAMYDSESRGNRLLERAKLAPELQRLVLIAAGNTLHFDPIRDALCMQFPDFRAAPQVHSAGGFQHHRQQRSDHGSASTTASSSSSSSHSSGSKGRGKSYGQRSGQFHRKVFQTEHHDEALAEIPEGEEVEQEDYQDAQEEHPDESAEPDQWDDADAAEDGQTWDDDSLQELASVLTVTSKKLQSTILGRKFSGKPRSIEERKRTSSCSSCGQMGHWEGDAVCPNSGKDSKGKSSGKGKSKHKSKDARPREHSNNTPKKAFVVHCPGEFEEYEDQNQDDVSATFHNFPTFVLNEKIQESYVTEVVDFGGYMIIDTACQRTCLGRRWLDVHSKILNKFGLTVKMIKDSDTFQFGAGPPQVSSQRAFFPAAFPEQDRMGLLLGASVLEDVNIPFLASNTLMEKLGVVIDMFNKQLHVHRLGISFPLEKRHRHLVAKIVCFPNDVQKNAVWKNLQKEAFWKKHDPELICPQSLLAQSTTSLSVRDRPHLDAVEQPASTGMASKLETAGYQGDEVGIQGLQGYEEAGGFWDCQPTMDDTPREDLRGGRAEGRSVEAFVSSSTQPEHMQSSTVPTVRKQARIVLPVSEVPHEVQMDPRAKRMAGSWIGKLISILTFAIALLRQHHPEGQAEAESSTKGYSQNQAFFQDSTVGWFDRGGGTPDYDGTRGGGSMGLRLSRSGTGMGSGTRSLARRDRVSDSPVPNPLNDDEEQDYWEVQEGLCIRHHLRHRRGLFRPCRSDVPVPFSRLLVHCCANIDYVDGRSDTLRYRWNSPGSFEMRDVPWTGSTVFQLRQPDPGNLLSHNDRRKFGASLRQATKVQEAHHILLTDKAAQSVRHRPRVDILETFAGKANISRRATKFKLKAAEPVDYNTGFDLARKEDQDETEAAIDRLRPLVLIQGFSCKEWTILQDNCNYIDRPEVLEQRRDDVRPLLRRVVDWCWKQILGGRYFVLENPTTSRIWQEPVMLELMKQPDVKLALCHGGAYGSKNSKGDMIRKPFTFMTNCPEIYQRLQKKLSSEELRQCVPLEGKETTLSQEYPPQMVEEILRGIKQCARRREPERFLPHQAFAVVHLNTDPEAWKDVFTSADTTFQTTSNRNFVLFNNDPLWKKISGLVGWHHLERIQLSSHPAMFRMPSHIPHTHRGWAILYSDGEIEVNYEDLGQVRHPRSRFRKSVRTAVFFYGYADSPHSQQETSTSTDRPPDSSPHQPSSAQPSDNPHNQMIEEKGFSWPRFSKVTQDIRRLVTRLHRNLGHPEAAEMKKLLAMNGIRDDHILRGVDEMVCHSCQRVKQPNRPPPASTPAEGYLQFGDSIQMDIVYIRDITSKNYAVLGIICESTHLHAVALLESREPDHVCSRLRQVWLDPYELPLTIRTDSDGAFRGALEDELSNLGIYIDYVPTESHNRIGLIERHNAIMRGIAEKVIDSEGITDVDGMQKAISAAAFSKNSCTWSSGRPPFVAALGRVPRIGFNLLSDERALVVGSTRSHAQQQMEKMRCEAQQHLASMTYDSSLRRALLRKVHPEVDFDVPVGSIVAYWRWTARSGKKRGGYRLARLLGKDPDKKSFWLQSGTNTIKVARHQMRLAHGFEQWVPDAHDLKALKEASENLKNGILGDERLPAGEEDPENPQGSDDFLRDLNAEFQTPNQLEEELLPVPMAAPVVPNIVDDQSPLLIGSQKRAAETDVSQLEEAVQTDPYIPIPQQTTTQQNIHFDISSPTYQNIHVQQQQQQQTHNLFGFTNEQAQQPNIRTPIRKPRLRSRTPVRNAPTGGPETATPAIQDAAASSQQQGFARSAEMAHTTPAPHGTEGEQNVPQHRSIDLTQDDVIHIDPTGPEQIATSVPRTPDGLASTDMANRLTPSKRSGEDLGAPAETDTARNFSSLYNRNTRLLRHQQGVYILTNDSHDEAKQHQHNMTKTWARLDLDNDKIQTTECNGPRKVQITHRRIWSKAGKLLYDMPYQPQEDHQTFLTSKVDTITELTYVPDSKDEHFNNLQVAEEGISMAPDGFDGTSDIYMPVNTRGDGQSDDSDAEFDDMTVGNKSAPSPPLSRIEQKALDKELPWRFILEQDPEYIKAFIQSAKDEETSWKNWNSIRPLSPQEAAEVRKSPILRGRIIKARAAYRDKSKGQPPLKAKTRVVAIGCADPDLFSLNRDCATPTRQSEYLVLAAFISGRNAMFNNKRHRWALWSGDVKTAFLQGVQEDRHLPLFLEPPKDGITKMAETFRSELYEILGNIYGLANAPRVWSREVHRRLISAGYTRHTLDHQLYYLWRKLPGESYPSLCSMIIVYVDDFLMAHDIRYDRRHVLDLFTWGSKSELEHGAPLEFKGKEIHLEKDDKDGLEYLRLTQEKFISSLTSGKAAKNDQQIRSEDLPEFRSVAGSLQWLSGQTRPDVAATVSLSSKGGKSTYRDLANMYEAIDLLKRTKTEGFNMYPVPINQGSVFVSFSDSSWANARDHASQHGSLILICDPRVSEFVQTGLLLDWKSSRSSRVCRSTLAAETSAADTSVDRCMYLAYLLTEMLQNCASFQLETLPRTLHITDCKSLYDCIAAENPSTEEKRVIISIRAIQEHVTKDQIHWVPTDLMWADALTKTCGKLMQNFQSWLQKPWIKLRKTELPKKDSGV